jgi:glutamate-1-semialdehyde 2,1-aminomutase
MNSGVELWKKAKKLIPGGNQLLSKRSEMFLPDQWPSYYKKAKGCEVWDMDGNHYYDFAQMGVGSCTLGYADDDINAVVIDAIQNSSMCSLNSYEEVMLAEKLMELHPWAHMARFSRTGGEACSIAIRIARAATGRNKVAFCGYHGWHDWYISSNIANDSNLDEQLLPGLKPAGVPRQLQGTAVPFMYNDIASIKDVVEKNKDDLAAIIMEPQRSTAPDMEFLKTVRGEATRAGAVLIFDEVTSGFRVNLGGIHMTLGIEPDMAVFGKALGNGFPISAIIGKREIMDAAQTSFISSTFWTERLGFAAGVATLKKMKEVDNPSHLVHWGKAVNDIWIRAAKENGLDIHISGIEPLTHMDFEYENRQAMMTLYAQILLEKGFLLGASVYATYVYNDEIMKMFEDATFDAFGQIAKLQKEGGVENALKGGIKHTGFRRLV